MQNKIMLLLFSPLSRLGLSHKLQATALWSMLESFSNPLFSLLLIPVFTHHLGLENYGLYVMVMAFVSFFSFTGLGMNTSITYYLAVNYQTSSPEEVAERLGAAIFISLAGTVTFGIIFLLVSLELTSIPATIYPQLVIEKDIVYLALGLVITTQLDMVIAASLKGLQKFKISSQTELLIRLLNFFIISIIASNYKSVRAIILTTFLLTILNLTIRYKVLSKSTNFNLFDLKLNTKNASMLFHYGKWMTLQNFAVTCFGSLDKLIIGTVLGNKVLGIYNVLISISQLAHYIPANVLVFLTSVVAKNKKNISISILLKSFVFVITVSLFSASLVVSLKEPIFSKFDIPNTYTTLYYWLITSYVLLSLNIPSYFIGLGMNLVKEVSIQCALGSITGVVLLIILIDSYGLFGAIVSKLIYSFVALFLVVPVLKKIRLAK